MHERDQTVDVAVTRGVPDSLAGCELTFLERQTLEILEALNLEVRTLDVSEFLKAEAALTCKSLLFRRGGAEAACGP